MKNKSQSINLLEGSIWKKIFVFFLPLAAGTVIQQLYNAVDGIIVGRFVGTEALAAVGGSTTMIINLIIGFFVALTAGAAVVIAQIYGGGMREDVKKASFTALVTCTVIGLAVSAAGYILAPQMLRIMKTPANIMEYSVQYLRIYFLGVPFIMVLNMESNTLRAVGDSFDPFVYMVICCVINIVLDYVFVVSFGWDVTGAAVATVIAQVINAVLLTVKLCTTDESYRMDLKNTRFDMGYLKGMLKIGIPAGCQSSMYSVSNLIIQVGINTLGTVVIASWAMTSRTDGFFWAASSALGSAITTFVGQNYGAGKYDRVRGCLKEGMILSLGITVIIGSLLLIFGRGLLNIMTPDGAVAETTFFIMKVFIPFYLLWTVIEVISAILRGKGDAFIPMVIIGTGICLTRIIWVMTVFDHFGNLLSLCLCYHFSWLITALALIIYYRKSITRKENRH